MKRKMLQWMMTNLCTWICVEENTLFRQVYGDCFDWLSRQTRS